jgi:hypothetical protein
MEMGRESMGFLGPRSEVVGWAALENVHTLTASFTAGGNQQLTPHSFGYSDEYALSTNTSVLL